ncbi:glycosyltransferase family 2 protein [Cryobacterium sp. N22]|uniref:glycosyltransferase family 2 protein n=1 Tax=Cryobacterium sp. N22 TaxID=2048290 RepID=UPI000CE4AAD9|nr:glycosyltransferase family 2 protein [Cryobacterium sp. N22]
MQLPAELGIVVVNRGVPDLLELNLVGIGRRARAGRVVVVDNFSGLANREATTALCAREGWTLLAPGLDLGFGAAVNAGVRLLRSHGCDRLLILSPDVRIDEPGVLALAQGCSADPQRILSPRIVDPDGSVWFGGGAVDLRRGRARMDADADSSAPGGWLSGACLMVHASLWDWLDGCDEGHFRSWADVDLSWRCVAAGGSLTVVGDVTAVRSAGSFPAAGEVSPLDVYSACRSRLSFAARHLGRRQIVNWLLSSPGYAVSMLGGGRHRLRAGQPGALLVAAVRGTTAGARLALRTIGADVDGAGRGRVHAEQSAAG